MHIAIVTLFPELFGAFAETSFVGRARAAGAIELSIRSLREHGVGRHLNVDDAPYGGGSGMVMRVDCIVAAMEAAEAAMAAPIPPKRVALTPQGQPFSQATARELSQQPSLLLVCGRYEGFDDRLRHFVDREISLGDFVLSGGEVAAMALLEAIVRLLPGVLGNEGSLSAESFSESLDGLLEYPQFTRPPEFRGHGVPEVLQSGDHGRIADWRRSQAEARTRQRRPDLLEPARPTKTPR